MASQYFSIYGRVQGVGFRYFTWKQANKMGITGWVKNLSDGSVAVLAQGAPSDLAQFKQWLTQGPASARVDRILEQEGESSTYTEFSILPDGKL